MRLGGSLALPISNAKCLRIHVVRDSKEEPTRFVCALVSEEDLCACCVTLALRHPDETQVSDPVVLTLAVEKVVADAAAINCFSRRGRPPQRATGRDYRFTDSARMTVIAWPWRWTRSPVTLTRTVPPRLEAW